MKIAICAIGYNRVSSLSRLLLSLNSAIYDEDVTLIISLDRSKSFDVKYFSDSFEWKHGNKIIVLQECNMGLRRHVLRCGQYMDELGIDALVVLEDDVTVSPYFYSYVRQCVFKYHNDDSIAGISLYNFPINYITGFPFTPVNSQYDVYLMNCAMSWGQVWMKDKWKKFIEWYNSNNEEFSLSYLPAPINQWPKTSWLKYHTRYCIENNLYFVYPYVSLTTNNSDPGTHNLVGHSYMQSRLVCIEQKEWNLPLSINIKVKYDGFFEPKFLHEHLKISEDNLVVNINGTKTECVGRYELTTKRQPYKVLKSFGLKYKPIEANVLLNVEGQDIFLYDRTVIDTKPMGLKPDYVLEYFYLNVQEKLYMWSNFKRLCISFFKYHILRKIIKLS